MPPEIGMKNIIFQALDDHLCFTSIFFFNLIKKISINQSNNVTIDKLT